MFVEELLLPLLVFCFLCLASLPNLRLIYRIFTTYCINCFRSQDVRGGVAAAPVGVLPPLPGLPAQPAPHLQDLQQQPAAKCLRQGDGTLSSHLRLAKSEEY